MKATIEEISKEYNCDPKHIHNLLDWVLVYPETLSNHIRSMIIRSIIGFGDDLPSGEITLCRATINAIGQLEYTANLLQDIAENKIDNQIKKKHEILS